MSANPFAIVEPDVKAALVQYLRAHPAIAFIKGGTNTWVKNDMIAVAGADDSYYFFISIVRSGQLESQSPHLRYRFDIFCYGPNGYDAARLYRTVRAVLVPKRQGINGFNEPVTKTSVIDVAPDGGPRDERTPEGFPFVWSSYIVTATDEETDA